MTNQQLSEDDLNKAMNDLKDMPEFPETILVTSHVILAKAIQKAIDGGWSAHEESVQGLLMAEFPQEYIFDHDFAKALWGERLVKHQLHQIIKDGKKVGESYGEWPIWKTHLQQMVIADDPIRYLGENI